MPGIQEPVSELWYGWDVDESGWANQVDSNFQKIGALMNLGVISRSLTAPPASPANGACYIVGSPGSGAWSGRTNQIAVWRAILNAWEFYVPKSGWLAGVAAEGIGYMFNGTSWVAATSGPMGTMAAQNANAVAITGGTVAGLSSLDVNGNVVLSGSGRKFLADMSNSNFANRLAFQTSQVNGSTALEVIPNGSMNASGMGVSNSSDINNCCTFRVFINNNEARLQTRTSGTGVDVPWIFRSAGGVANAHKSVSGDWLFGNGTADSSCKLQTTNGINLGNTANANANVLDWYEEGTFTPVVTGTTTAGTATTSGSQNGKYTRVGNKVSFELICGWTAHTGTGNLQIAGLPFTSSSSPSNAVLCCYYDGLTVGAGKELAGLIVSSSSNISLRTSDPAGGGGGFVAMDTAVASIRISGTYFV